MPRLNYPCFGLSISLSYSWVELSIILRWVPLILTQTYVSSALSLVLAVFAQVKFLHFLCYSVVIYPYLLSKLSKSPLQIHFVLLLQSRVLPVVLLDQDLRISWLTIQIDFREVLSINNRTLGGHDSEIILFMKSFCLIA